MDLSCDLPVLGRAHCKLKLTLQLFLVIADTPVACCMSVFQVTIFGDSAGAQSVLLHLSLPYSERLFHRAIVQSSPIAIPYFSRSQAGALGAVLSGKTC